MGALLDALVNLPPWLVLTLVFVLPAAEAALFVGLVIPGETAVLIGGVAAHSGALPLWAVIAAAIGGAAVGDQVGYLIGRRYGSAVLQRLPRWLMHSGDVARALDLLARRGALAVVLGRWVAALRALVPGLAGVSGISHVRFTVANVLGGALWASTVAVAGYLAGASYRSLEQRFGIGGEVLAAVVLVLIVAWVVRGRRARGHPGTPRAE